MSKKVKRKNKNESITLATSLVKAHPFYIFIVVLWGLYLYFFMQSPNTTTGQIHVSDQQLQLLRLSVAAPYLLIWLSAAYAYVKIKRYAVGIRPSVESHAFDRIATGILLLLSSLILSTILSTLRTYLTDFPETRPILTILTNYAYVLPYLLAFGFLLKGTRELVHQQTNFKVPAKTYIFYGVSLAIFSYFWLEVIFTNQARLNPGPASQFATYYLKDSLLILTIVIPALLTWIIGTLTVIKLRIYFKKLKGIIYKRAISSLVSGLIGVIFGSIFLQALMALGTQRLVVLGLGRVLLLIYVFLFIQVLGYFLIARGANKLTKIETA